MQFYSSMLLENDLCVQDRGEVVFLRL